MQQVRQGIMLDPVVWPEIKWKPSCVQVCVTDNTWLVGRREQANVRKDRCVTTENLELEPWFFAFRKVRNLP